MKPYVTVSTKDMDCEEWLKLRKSGLGGSDAGAVCGVNPYSSPMKVYLDKISEKTEQFDNEAMRQGRDLEEYVAKRFTEETGLLVRRSRKLYRSRNHPFMLADIDRLIVGEEAGLECKTANAFQAEQWKSGAIPSHYLMQCIHYMAVTGKKRWYLAVVILGKEFQYRRIERDEEMIQRLITIEEKFWKSNVMLNQLPEPDGSHYCDEALEELYQRPKETREIPLIGFDERLAKREKIMKTIAKLEKEQKRIEQEVKLFLKDHEAASSELFGVRWANVDTKRLDTKRLKEERPEIYKEFLSTTCSRRLFIKAS